MTGSFFDGITDRVLVFDGAMGTQIQLAELGPDAYRMPQNHADPRVQSAAARLGDTVLEGCSELLCLTRPDFIQSVHEGYLDAGSDLIETNSFGTTSIVLGEYDAAEIVYPLALAAGQIARAAADSRSAVKPRWVVGALGPGTKLLSLGQATWDVIEATYTEAFEGLLDGGVDALLLETLQDLLMVKAGVIAAGNAMKSRGKTVPLFVQVTMEQTGTMLVGSDLSAALASLEMFPHVSAVGINCATGPTEMAPHIRYLGQNSTRPISVQPNAGLPTMEHGHAVYKLTPDELAEAHAAFITESGAAFVGGCCGTTPTHIKATVERVKGLKPSPNAHWRQVSKVYAGFDFNLTSPERDQAKKLIGCASLFTFQPYVQDNSILYIGEKTNANGSKAFREMLGVENWDGLTELAQETEAEGSHVLDVCTAYVGRDEVRDMRLLLNRYNQTITIPLMIDSTEVPVVEEALKCTAGKPIINSINFEDGGARAHKVLELARRYGAALVALTIDEKGMAKTRDEKAAIAERLMKLAREYGVAEHDMFIDALTFTLGSGDEEFRMAAVETIEAIREIKRMYPAVNTVLGISNISFGLRPVIRRVVNSAFLHYATEAGLTSAIVHVSKILSESQIDQKHWSLASDLVYDRRKYSDGQVA